MFEQNTNVEDAKIIIIGVPYDGSTSNIPGTRLGPKIIKDATNAIEIYSPYLDKEIDFSIAYDEINVFDNNGLDIFEKLHEKLWEHRDKIVVCLGGDHSISSVPIIHISHSINNLHVLHLDAHTDFRDTYVQGSSFGKMSHASVMKRVYDAKIPFKQWGIRSGTKEEFQQLKELNTLCYSRQDVEEYLEYLSTNNYPLYITFDVDALEGFKSTGTVEPNGLSTNDIMWLIKKVKLHKVNLISFDIVEYNPMLDNTARQDASIVATFLRELLLLLDTK